MSLQSPASKSPRILLAEEKAKRPPFNVFPERNAFQELLITEANFLDDLEASIAGIQSALTKANESEQVKLRELDQVMRAFLQRQENVFQLMLEEKNPNEWTTAIYKMQDAYMQMLLILESARFSEEANQAFKGTVRALKRVPEDIHAYLSKPMQRLQRYHMLLGEIIKSMSPDKISGYNAFAQNRLKSLNRDYVEAQLRHLNLAQKSNVLYGIVSAAQQYQNTVAEKKTLTLPLERIVTDSLRKKDNMAYILPTDLIASALQGYLKDPAFLQALQKAIDAKKGELAKTLIPEDKDLLALQFLTKEAFREQLPLRQEREGLEAIQATLRKEIALLVGQRMRVSVQSRDHSILTNSLDEKKRALSETTKQITELSTKISKLVNDQAVFEERHRQLQQQKKEFLREQHMPLRVDHHQLTLLQKDLQLAAQNVNVSPIPPDQAPSPRNQP